MNDEKVLLEEVIKVTREQLSRSMGVNAELEALIKIERAKMAELQKAYDALKASTEEKAD
jgi:hypothetical protein